MIDPRDVAATAAVVLATDGLEGQTYELTGREAITYGEIAEELSVATGPSSSSTCPTRRRGRAWLRPGCRTVSWST